MCVLYRPAVPDQSANGPQNDRWHSSPPDGTARRIRRSEHVSDDNRWYPSLTYESELYYDI